MGSRKFLAGFAIVCVSAVAGYGVSKSVNDDTELEVLTLGNVEALANGEDAVWGGWDNFWQGQGFWKDEREYIERCPEKTETRGGVSGSYGGGSVSGSGSHKQKNPSNRNDIRCATGSSNCTAIKC